MLAKLVNGNAVTAPSIGQLKDGRWVSNYNLLPLATLQAEGWKELTEIKPVYDKEKQYLTQDTAVEGKAGITVTYKAVEIPPDPMQAMETELTEVKAELVAVKAENTELKKPIIEQPKKG